MMKYRKSFHNQSKNTTNSTSSLTLEGKNRVRSIAILCSDDNYGFEFGCATELFIKQKEGKTDWYQTKVISLDALTPDLRSKSIVKSGKCKMLVITDGEGLGKWNCEALFAGLRLFHQSGGRIVAFGTGVYVLAAAGMLDGKKIPGNQLKLKRQAYYPRVKFCYKLHFSCGAGLYCSGSGYAALELGLYLIGKDWGKRFVQNIARNLGMTPSMVAHILMNLQEPYFNCSPKIKMVLEWAEANLDIIGNVSQLADRACISRRSFDRQFRTAMGISPREWLTESRLVRAKEYLEFSDLGIEEIADAIGFGTGNNFRNNFQKLTGLSPTEYRKGLDS